MAEADADVPQAEEAKEEVKEEEEETDPHQNEMTDEERRKEEIIQKKLEEIMGRDPKPWPGDGRDLNEAKDSIEFKWPKEVKSKKDCSTREMLYLLQLALERVRKRTNERNRYFRSINRKDRYISHLDGPQIITNFLDWHGEDKANNKFDGELVTKSPEMHLINKVIAKIGKVKLGPSTNIVIKLKETSVNYTLWTASHEDRLKKIKTRGYDRMYKGAKKLEECTVDEVITILTYKAPDEDQKQDDDAEKKDPVTGIFEMMEKVNAERVAKGKDHGHLFKEKGWKDKVVTYFRDNSLDGKKFTESDIKGLTSELVGVFGNNNKLKGGMKQMLNKLKACNASSILDAAPPAQK
eukprot:1117118_1